MTTHSLSTAPVYPSPLRHYVLGAVLGLYLGRVLAEAAPLFWRGWRLAPLVLLTAALGALLNARLAARPGRAWRTWPWAVALVYVCWPAPSTVVAALVGLAVAVSWLLANGLAARHTPWHDLALGAAALALYVGTLQPGLAPADSGEFQVAAATLGIAHPPGYALYTLLGRLFALLPLGDAAWRLNLFAAACAAGCVVVVGHAVGRHTGSGWAALAAGACLMVVPTFWVQGTVANIRSFTALLEALAIAQALRWERTRATRDLTLLGLILGLGAGHHSSLILLLPAFLAWVLLNEPRLLAQPRRWLGAIGAALASLLVIAYLPLRSAMHPAFAPSPVHSWRDLVSHVLALGFRGDMLRYTALADLLRRARALGQILRLEHGYALLALGLVATGACVARRWRLIVLVGGIWLLNVLSALTYAAPQTVEYLIPSYVAFAVLLGLGLAALDRPSWLPVGLLTACALAVALLGAASWSSMVALHRDDRTRQEAVALLEAAPPDALVLAGWHQVTPLWYLQIVDGLRPDVTITYVYPEGATPNAEVWLRRIREALPTRAVVVTHRFHALNDTGLWFTPLASGWLVSATPAGSSTGLGEPFGDPSADLLRLADWQLSTTTAAPGDTLTLDLTLAADVAPQDDYTLFAQVLGPSGVVAQDDRLVPTARLAAEQALTARLEPTLLLHCAPGDYTLVIGLYHSVEGQIVRLATSSGDTHSLGTIHVLPRSTAIASAHPTDRRWANGLRLIGLDTDHSVPEQTRLYLHLRAAQPLGGEDALLLTSGGVELARATLPALPANAQALVALDVPADVREVALSVASGQETVPLLGPWARRAGRSLPLDLSALGERYVPLGGEMALIGWDAACDGAECALTAQLLTLRPLTRDYALSLGVRGSQEVKSDGTPITGGVPTLKWLRGWRLADQRTIAAPDGLDPATGIFTVYDAFTLRTLPVLDERLAQRGQGTELLLPVTTASPAP